MKKAKLSMLSLILLCIFQTGLTAQGWIIYDHDGSTTFISGDWIKIEDPDEGSYTSIYNVENKSLILISHESEQYAEGSMADYCGAIKAMTDKMMDGMTPEQREMMEAYMSESNSGPPPNVKIESAGSGGNIAGYSTEKFNVMVDGELYEEVWISRDNNLMTLVEMFADKIEPMTSEIVKCSSVEINLESDPDFSEAYKNLQRSGFEMKSMRHEYGSPSPGSLITKIERKSISSDEFKTPAGYSRIDFDELLLSLDMEGDE